MDNKRNKKFSFRAFAFEIAADLVFLLLFAQLLNADFSRWLIESYPYFRPEYMFTLFVVFSVFVAVFVLWFAMQTRKKKLKSTKRMSPFARTLVRSDKERELSMTQTLYTVETGIVHGVKTAMPKDIDVGDPSIVDLYFNYEKKLDI